MIKGQNFLLLSSLSHFPSDLSSIIRIGLVLASSPYPYLFPLIFLHLNLLETQGSQLKEEPTFSFLRILHNQFCSQN